MIGKKIALIGLVLVTFSFGGGWLYGFKKIAPSEKFAHFLRGYTNNYYNFRPKPRYDHFNLSIPNPDVVFLGDSLTQSSLFSEMFISPIRIYNRGVGGDTAIDILNRLREIEKLNPQHVYLMVGINDLGRGATPSQVANNIVEIYHKLSEKGISTYVQETIQCQPSKCTYVSKINELNNILASKLKSKLVRLGELSSKVGLSKDLTYDGIHLNKKGYRVWADHLKDFSPGKFK